MRLPIRKPGKYTFLKAGAHLTEAKFNELEKKLRRLLAVRPGAAEEVKRLAELGDFSENAAYQIAKGRLRGLNQRILELEDQLNRAVIIRPDKNQAAVQLGSRVTVKTIGSTAGASREKTYLILGSAETDPRAGVISHNSPLGAALIGRRAGDTIKVKLAGGEAEYKIIRLE